MFQTYGKNTTLSVKSSEDCWALKTKTGYPLVEDL